ncbi:MAG: tRNA (guanosine(37)-N1)-methyltransferase TrmD [Parcubacteria group bacterium]|nr:tRNA (guanosine(37)-N1)-methyltransferase TrmD [Parcubacteria group bacterium]
MKVSMLTIFPEFFPPYFSVGVIGRAVKREILIPQVVNLRDFTLDAHKTTDDAPYGGGPGMVMMVEPIFKALRALKSSEVRGRGSENFNSDLRPPTSGLRRRVILLSAQGRLFTQENARQLTAYGELVFVCGRYEGVDERVAEHLIDEELSIGDYVVSGGELPALVVIDAVIRLLPGVVGNEESTKDESFSTGLGARGSELGVTVPPSMNPHLRPPTSEQSKGILDYPHYTRPEAFVTDEGEEWRVPEVLLSGNHATIAKWRLEASLAKTRKNRPDLLSS